MLASVAFTFQIGPGEGRLGFWKSFEENDPKRSGEVSTFNIERAITHEKNFRGSFAGRLQALINDDSHRLWKNRSKEGTTERTKPVTTKPVTIKLVAVAYSELKAILEILGDESFRNFAVQVLAIYSPIAFQQALQTDALPSARPELLDGGGPPVPETFRQQLAAMATPQFAVSVTSLLIPVAIAVWILVDARHAVHEEATELRDERNKIVEQLVNQNKSVSESLVKATKGAVANAKSMEDLFTSQVRKLLETALAPNSDVAALTASVKSLTASFDDMKSEADKLSARVAKLEQPPPSLPPVPSNCRKNVATADCARIQEALFRRVGQPVDQKNPGHAWNDGKGGQATENAIKAYLKSINEPEAIYLTPDQLRRLLF